MWAHGAARWAILVVAPLLMAVADPAGDVVGCRGGAAAGAPDLIDARGEIVELGTSARWTLTFAEPLELPDTEGRPFRIDVAIRDRDVPTVSFAFYRRINRLVRVDATIDHRTQILLIPERATNVFTPPTVDGTTITIQVPGRTLSDDEDLTGTSPGLERLRWTVIVRDERACDVLGDGRPRNAFVVPAASPSAGSGGPPDGAEGPDAWWIAAAAVLVAAAGYALLRRTSR